MFYKWSPPMTILYRWIIYFFITALCLAGCQEPLQLCFLKKSISRYPHWNTLVSTGWWNICRMLYWKTWYKWVATYIPRLNSTRCFFSRYLEEIFFKISRRIVKIYKSELERLHWLKNFITSIFNNNWINLSSFNLI